jgi:DNA-binding transcriptional MerR regulator
MRLNLKETYSSREVAALTGLTARQLQWWDANQMLSPAIAPQRTAAGGFTARRYSPVHLLELLVLADLRRRGFSLTRIRRLLETLKDRFGIRLFEAIGGGAPVRLFTDGNDVYARTEEGQFFSLVKVPGQPLLEVGEQAELSELTSRIRARRKLPARPRRRKANPSP